MAEQGTGFWDCDKRWMGQVGGVEDRLKATAGVKQFTVFVFGGVQT